MLNVTSLHIDADEKITSRVFDVGTGKCVNIRVGNTEVDFYLRNAEQADVLSGIFGAAWDLEDVLFDGPVSDGDLPGEGQHSATQADSEQTRTVHPDQTVAGLTAKQYKQAHTTPSNEPQTIDS